MQDKQDDDVNEEAGKSFAHIERLFRKLLVVFPNVSGLEKSLRAGRTRPEKFLEQRLQVGAKIYHEKFT